MQSASSSSIEESKSVKKTPAKRAKASKRSKDSDKKAEQSLIDVEASVHHGDANESEQSLIADDTSDTVREDQTFGQGELKDVNEYLKGKVGIDIIAKHWLGEHEQLSGLEKSELLLRLTYELCLAKNPDYDLENEAAENNKKNNFDTRRIFQILEKITEKVSSEDRKKFTQFICQSGDVRLLEMICKQESEGSKVQIDQQYPCTGKFTGYKKLIHLLKYVLEQQCFPEIVLCIAKKVYGRYHNVLSGREYLKDGTIEAMKEKLGQPDQVMEECLKSAIELGYKDVVSVMLGGDIYHCIRLMKGEKFQEEKRFGEALKMIEETVAEVMSSWVKDKRQSFKDEVQGLLAEGIEIKIEKMGKQDLIAELEYLGIGVEGKIYLSKKELVKMLKEEGGGKVRLRKTVVGGLISTLFFNYQKELMKEPFELKISSQDKNERKEEINELNENIDSESFVKEKVLEKIKSLNSCSHVKNNQFFREVLSAIVNDEERFNELKAVYTAICKESLKGVEVHEDDVFKCSGAESNQVKTSTPKISIFFHFSEKIKDLAGEISEWDDESSEYEISSLAKILLSNKTPAFSGLSRKIIVELKNKKRNHDEEKKLEKAVDQILGEIEEGIKMLTEWGSEYCIDTEDVFEHFRIINSEIEKEKDKRKIVELICQKGNVQLLEMICKQEVKDKGSRAQIDLQYPWQGKFTGYKTLTDLLQYVIIEQPCSSEVVLCIAKKVYGRHHNVLSGREYLKDSTIEAMKEKLGQPDQVMEECLKAAIGYKDVVSVMLGGDIYHCIRLMKDEKFKEGKEALEMIEETVAEVMSSWVNCKQDLSKQIKGLLRGGITIDINKIGKKELIDKLEDQRIKVKNKSRITKKELVKKLRGEKVEIRLRKTVVGGLISTLFFNYQKELTELVKNEKPFKLKVSERNKDERKEEINELDENIDDESFVKEKVLEKIKLLNSSSHISNNWFFREVLSAIVNDEEKFNKLKAVCAAICKEKVEELLRGAEVHEDVVDALGFFGVDTTKRDLGTVGPVETMDLNEYISPSSEQFLTETNKLSGQDIVDIAKYYYRWMEPINGKYLEDTKEKVFFTCTDVPSLEDKLKHYKEIKQNNLIFTSIISTGKEHWVTLVVARSVKDGKFSAYYCDSFGRELSKKMSDVLKKALEIDANCISSSQIKQQKDEYNCGIFALANAYKITRIIKDKSFTEINVELKGKLDAGQLRKEFAKKVEEMRQSERNSEANSEDESVIMQDSVENVSSRQPSAKTSRDPPKISITPAKMAPEVKVLPSVSPGSKAVEKKNEEVMQSNCRQGENSSYNEGKDSYCHGGKVGSISGGLGMLSGINFQELDKKEKEASTASRARGLLGKVGKKMDARPPSIQQLLKAGQMICMEKALDKVVLNYNKLSYNGLYRSGSFDQSLDESFCEEEELHELFKSNGNFIKYENAVSKLVSNNVKAAKNILLDLVNDAVQPAYYAYVLMFFKETIRQCDVLNTAKENDEIMEKSKDDINASVQLLKRASLMEPASSFLIGMMKRYDIGKCSQFMDGSWRDDLICVVNVARDYSSFNIEQYILESIDHNNRWDYEKCGLGMQKKGEYIKEMGKYSLYELTLSMLSEQHFNADAVNDLFKFLSEDEFPEALYSYGAALLQAKVGNMSKEDIKEAMRCLNRAASAGHREAGFLLGTLPFSKVSRKLTHDEVKRCILRLEDYINSSEDSCTMNKENVDKAAYCLAVEYYIKESHLVQHDKHKAEVILESRGMYRELSNLQSRVGQSFTLSDSSTISPSFSSEQTFSPVFSSSKIGSSSSGCATMLDDDSKSSSMPKTDLHNVSTKEINDSLSRLGSLSK